jgi:peptidoglycan hydrolase-like protein with peptidoglycan-binding domain
MVRYVSPVFALLLLLAASVAAAAAEGTMGDMGKGGMQQDMGAGRGAMAPGLQCDKRCVMDLQRQLRTQGIYKGPVDGKPGRMTQQAVRQYQSQQGMKPTGMIDEQVLSALKVRPARGAMEMERPAAAPLLGRPTSPGRGGK